MINEFYLWQLSELSNIVSGVAIQTVADIVTSLAVILRKKTKESFMNWIAFVLYFYVIKSLLGLGLPLCLNKITTRLKHLKKFIGLFWFPSSIRYFSFVCSKNVIFFSVTLQPIIDVIQVISKFSRLVIILFYFLAAVVLSAFFLLWISW